MDISKDENKQKPIGRRLDYLSNPKAIGVAPATVAFIVIITAIFSFVAGTRVDDYISIGGALGSSSLNEDLPADLDYSSVERVFDELKVSYDGELTTSAILDGIKKGLAESTGDPYTAYFNAEQAKEFQDDLNGTFSGIGAEIGRDGEFIIVVAPLAGFPADEAGLKPQDIIFEIDGEDAISLSIDEAVSKIRGEEGTDVVLNILRDGEQLEVTITRGTIVVPSVTSEITDEGVGVLKISRFASDTERLAKFAVNMFVDENVKGVILDLRNNSGGFLDSAVDISSLWLDGILVMQVREDNGAVVVDELMASRGADLSSFKTVVLINKGSASASEIVAGALQDHDQATIMGVTSFGKGSVQDLRELRDGGVLKVTTARWYTPNGINIDSEGIVPDIEVEYEETEDPEFDNQLQTAIDYILE